MTVVKYPVALMAAAQANEAIANKHHQTKRLHKARIQMLLATEAVAVS